MRGLPLVVIVLLAAQLLGCGACPLASRGFWLGAEGEPAAWREPVDGLEYPYSGYYYLEHDRELPHLLAARPSAAPASVPPWRWSLMLPYAGQDGLSGLDRRPAGAYK